MPKTKSRSGKTGAQKIDWKEVARTVLISRKIDHIEENELVPAKKVLYQFSARGHDVAQVILGQLLNHPHDGAGAYYRSRPFMLSIGLTVEDAISAPMMKSGGYSDGRDIGVVCNMPAADGKITVQPMSGDVGSQYTPSAGWAQAIEYRRKHLKERRYSDAISVVLGGDGSVATNGFWSSLTIATTLELPMLFFIEDNGYGISVPRDLQTPGGNIVDNLRSFKNLTVFDGDGTDPQKTAPLLKRAVNHVRGRKGPAMVRLTIPRLSGHSGQDNQAYKPNELIEWEKQNDPMKKLEQWLLENHFSKDDWKKLQEDVEEEVREALDKAEERPEPDPDQTTKYLLYDDESGGSDEMQKQGGLLPEGHEFPAVKTTPEPEKQRINLVEAIRRTLDYELKTNPKVLVFGEDVGQKGGVHAITMGLQTEHGEQRVFDTSLSEEGIIGRAVGMAYAGLMPVPEIQFRKYSDPATEQLNNLGTIRWRTANRFAAPMVVRMPGGFAKIGDPWHSVTNETFFAHAVGWQVASPSNAEDAVGLLRYAMRSNNPTMFFEHRNLLDAKWARRPYPGDEYIVPFGKARRTVEGNEATIVTWGAMVERCEQAVEQTGISADVLDLRTLFPWDKQAVLDSIQKTNRCLIVHEDSETAGFGAEISAVIVKEAFTHLDAPVDRLAMPDVPVPHNLGLMDAVVPSPDKIGEKLHELISFW